jgi:hypothetical protein
MFVIEAYLKSRRAKVLAWEQARTKWLNDDDYAYRSELAWQRHHPYPVFNWKKFVQNAVPIIGIVLVVGTVVSVIVADGRHDREKTEKPAVAHVQRNDKECENIKVNDHVQISYGDYADAKAKVLKVDCQKDDYLVELDNDQKIAYIDSNGGHHTRTIPDGFQILVNSHDNLYVIK